MLNFTPNVAVVLLTVGVALICLELNRPGLVLPGSCGLLCTLLAVGALAKLPLRPAAAATLLGCFALLATNLWRPLPRVAPAALVAILFAALARLPSPASHTAISWPVALSCAVLLGTGISGLTTIARRARQNKGLDLTQSARLAPGAPPS